MSVLVSVCLCVYVSVYVHDNSNNNGSIHLKLEHIAVYENSSDECDIGIVRLRSIFSSYVRLECINTMYKYGHAWMIL